MAAIYICNNCGYVGKPKSMTRGSFIIEIMLYFFFVIPGLFYTVWRLTSRYNICPACMSQGLIPADTPRGQKLMAEMKAEQPKKTAS